MRRPDRRRFIGLAACGALAASGRAVAAEPAYDLAAAGRVVDAFARAEPFYGVVQFGRAGRIESSRAFGLRDIEAGAPMQVDTRFCVASISKWFSSILVLRLVDQGRLSLDAPLTDVLADYRADTGRRVTLRRLLSNTSGVPNGFLTAARADASLMSKAATTAEAVRLYASGDLAFEPGARFDYSMTNWILVRAAVERAAGEPFETAMERLVLKPLGLADTGAPLAAAGPGLAAPYRTIAPPVRKPSVAPAFAVAGGGYYSTAADLARAAEAVFRPGLLTAASLKALTTVEVPDERYALGGRVKTLTLNGRERRFAWETGNSGGYKAVLACDLDSRRTLTVLNNTDLTQKRLDQFAEEALRALYGDGPVAA
ncbi:MAG: beta-lactamase family protein [Caulobacteraceae bacterium]|nr:beta-lactamase family protein [Caulobacteraceae bacterium]